MFFTFDKIFLQTNKKKKKRHLAEKETFKILFWLKKKSKKKKKVLGVYCFLTIQINDRLDRRLKLKPYINLLPRLNHYSLQKIKYKELKILDP